MILLLHSGFFMLYPTIYFSDYWHLISPVPHPLKALFFPYHCTPNSPLVLPHRYVQLHHCISFFHHLSLTSPGFSQSPLQTCHRFYVYSITQFNNTPSFQLQPPQLSFSSIPPPNLEKYSTYSHSFTRDPVPSVLSLSTLLP